MSILSRVVEAARALRSRNYRLFFAGQSTSLVGTWMTRVATSRCTGLPDPPSCWAWSGPPGKSRRSSWRRSLEWGSIDWDRHRTLVVTQVFSMLQ